MNRVFFSSDAPICEPNMCFGKLSKGCEYRAKVVTIIIMIQFNPIYLRAEHNCQWPIEDSISSETYLTEGQWLEEQLIV
jgi:hypothetical protein